MRLTPRGDLELEAVHGPPPGTARDLRVPADQVVLPLGLCIILQRTGTLEARDIWLAILLGHMTRCGLSVLKFREGRWREIKVAIDPA